VLQAFLKGKLSAEQENLEDLLTSSVGLLAYVPPERALLPFLTLPQRPATCLIQLTASPVIETAVEKAFTVASRDAMNCVRSCRMA
jgi:hypothetical protein